MSKFSAKSSKVEIQVPGCEGQVDDLFEAQEYIDEGNAVIDNLRPFVQTAADTSRIEAERHGGFAKTVSVLGTKGEITFTFGNRFSEIPLQDEESLRTALTPAVFETLFERAKKVKVRPEAMSDLLALLDDEADKFLEVEEVVVAKKNFRETRFELRDSLSESVNETLDAVVDRFGAKPSMKFKPQA